MSRLEKWKRHDYPVPEKMLHWPLRGAGFDNLGVGGEPVEVDTPKPAAGELLLRVDATGLCFSDVKLIRAGNEHPRVKGRDLSTNPTRPGHEVAMTVAAVGESLEAEYSVGDRFIIQADVFYKGVGLAFGYAIPGRFSQYVIAGKEILQGDEGNYLLPVPSSMGYAQAALVEPWACIVASVASNERDVPLEGGRALIVECGRKYSGKLLDREDVTISDGAESTLRSLDGGFDDIIICGTPTPESAAVALEKLKEGGLLALCSEEAMSGTTQVDIGAIHYKGIRIAGSASADADSAYSQNNRTNIKGGGTAWFIGAAGPMGQIHVQHALELDSPPKKLIVSDPSAERVEYAMRRWLPVAEKNGVEILSVDPTDFANEEDYHARLMEETGGEGFDDIVILAPVPVLVSKASKLTGRGCVVNVFAGIPVGTMIDIDISDIYMKGVRFIGTSGSKIADLRKVLELARAGKIDTNRSLAVIGGVNQFHEAIRRVAENGYLAKAVIFPGVNDFPVTAPEELPDADSDIRGLLAPGGVWTTEAEDAFLQKHLDAF